MHILARMRRLIGLAGLTLIVLMSLTACGDDNGEEAEEETTSPTTTAADTTGTTTRPTQELPDDEDDCEDARSEPNPVIEMQDFRFVPDCLVMTGDQPFGTDNTGSSVHNISIEGVPGIDIDTEPGLESNYESTGLDPDVYTFFCKYHRGQGMEGELRISSG